MPSTKDTFLLFRSADLYVVRKADDVVIKDDDANARGGRLAIVARRNRYGIGTAMVIDPSIIIESMEIVMNCGENGGNTLLWRRQGGENGGKNHWR